MDLGNMNIPDEKLTGLLDVASKKLGRDPKELQAELESGKLDSLLGNMDPKAASKVNSLLQNPDALKAMLNNDKVKNMLNGLMGGQKK